ncbi:MAG: ethanolamine ammonia-lyase subunit EutC [Burkholderiales bacterium]|nr:ethanolamine ammonia-lyase subunit EutC [Burkholderiales bacterium]
MSCPDPWADLKRHTAARIALGRSGASQPTAAWLQFSLDQALARDAVRAALDVAALQAALAAHALDAIAIESAAPDRASYLRRPDLGRRLSPRSAAVLAALPAAAAGSIAVLVADGLSAAAAQAHALPLLLALRPRLQAQGQALGPVVIATQARVALGDAVGALTGAAAVLVLLGERPGLSSPDSLGAYLTWAPRPGRSDAERNCVSNIRPAGLPHAEAARRLAWLLAAARRLGASGVALKDESDAPALQGPARYGTIPP